MNIGKIVIFNITGNNSYYAVLVDKLIAEERTNKGTSNGIWPAAAYNRYNR